MKLKDYIEHEADGTVAVINTGKRDMSIHLPADSSSDSPLMKKARGLVGGKTPKPARPTEDVAQEALQRRERAIAESNERAAAERDKRIKALEKGDFTEAQLAALKTLL